MMTVKRQKSKSSQSSTLSHSNRGKGRTPAWPFAPPRRASQVAGRGARASPSGGAGQGPRGGLQRRALPPGPPWSRGPDRSATDSQGRPRVQGFSSPAGSGGLSPGRSCPAARGRASLTPPAPTFTDLAVGSQSGAERGAQCLAGMGGESRSPPRTQEGRSLREPGTGGRRPCDGAGAGASHPEEAVCFPGGPRAARTLGAEAGEGYRTPFPRG